MAMVLVLVISPQPAATRRMSVDFVVGMEAAGWQWAEGVKVNVPMICPTCDPLVAENTIYRSTWYIFTVRKETL